MHIPLAFFFCLFLVVLCWPHIIVEINKNNFFEVFSTVINNTLSLKGGPKLGLINGEFYETLNTPRTYFLNILLYRIPIYFSFLILATYFLMIFKKLNYEFEIKNFNKIFYLTNLIAFFPIIISVILSISIHDNIRLFLFIIPFFSIVAALSLNYFFETLKNYFVNKLGFIILLILFSISFYRFIMLTPY